MNEQRIQSKILKYLESLPNVYARKIGVAGKKGTPDILACVRGRFVGTDTTIGFMLAIEVKAPGGKPTEIQKYNLKQINECGGLAIIAYSVDDVKGAIDEYKKAHHLV